MNNDRGPSLISKYVWLIETIYRAKKISFDDINERWCRNTDMSGGEALPERTFHRWSNVIFDTFGIIIVNERCGDYRYYIENADDLTGNGVQSWLYNTLSVSNALASSQSIKDRILLEYVPSGQQYLQPVIEAMKENRVIHITYYNYWKDKESSFDVEPLCVKLFRQRWYMVALNPFFGDAFVYSLDRIRQLTVTDQTFKMPKDWSAEQYFQNCFGIIANADNEPQIIKLKVYEKQANYIRDLKLHESQKEIERNADYSIFRYFLRPEYDFIQEILRNGDTMEVLQPQKLRQDLANITKQMCNIYNQ